LFEKKMKVGLRCAQNSVVKKKFATTLIKKKVKFDEFTFATGKAYKLPAKKKEF